MGNVPDDLGKYPVDNGFRKASTMRAKMPKKSDAITQPATLRFFLFAKNPAPTAASIQMSTTSIVLPPGVKLPRTGRGFAKSGDKRESAADGEFPRLFGIREPHS